MTSRRATATGSPRPSQPPGRRIVLAAMIASAVGVAAVIALLWFASQQVLFPFWYRPGLPPVTSGDNAWETWQGIVRDPKLDLGLDFEDVAFPAVDETTLRGWFVPAARATDRSVVAVHGGASDRRDFLRHVPMFHEAGYGTLLFDCREHGLSDRLGRGISLGFRESEDVSSAVSYMKARGFGTVAVIGTSQGASSAIIAAARDPDIAAVIAENPVASILELLRGTIHAQRLWIPAPLFGLMRDVALWRMGASGKWESIDVVSEIAPRPLLLMHGTADEVVPPKHSELLFGRAGQPTDVWWADGAHHMRLFNRHPDEYRKRVLGFLRRHLGTPGGASGDRG